MNSASANPNNTFAIVAVADEIPEKPRKPATTEMARKMRAHFSMTRFRKVDAEEECGRAGRGSAKPAESHTEGYSNPYVCFSAHFP